MAEHKKAPPREGGVYKVQPKKGNFFQLPNSFYQQALYFDKAQRMSSGELAVFGHLYTYWRQEKQAPVYPSQTSVASALGLSEKTVNTALRKLVEKGWVTVSKGKSLPEQQHVNCRYNLKCGLKLLEEAQEHGVDWLSKRLKMAQYDF